MSAIKKSDVGKLSNADLEVIARAQNYINPILNREFRRRNKPATVSLDALTRHCCGQFERIVLDYLIATYREAGWKVSENHDQREGDWLSFS